MKKLILVMYTVSSAHLFAAEAFSHTPDRVMEVLRLHSYTPVTGREPWRAESVETMLRNYLGDFSPGKVFFRNGEDPHCSEKTGIGIDISALEKQGSFAGVMITQVFRKSAKVAVGQKLAM